MPQQDSSGPAKPGWTTTEFYQSLLLQVAAVVVAIVTIIRPDFNLDSFQALVPVISVALAAIAQIAYTISRTKVKVAALNASTQTESQSPSTQLIPAQATVDASGDAGSQGSLTQTQAKQIAAGVKSITTALADPSQAGAHTNGAATGHLLVLSGD